MQSQAFDWNTILSDVGVRRHPIYSQLEQADFSGVIRQFDHRFDRYGTLANYLIFGAAAVLGRDQQASADALTYHGRLNTKTKAVTLYFWAEEAVAHQQYQTAEGFVAPLLEAYPSDPFLNALMATCCFYSQELPRGWPYLEQGLANAPKHKGLNSLLCRFLLGDGDLQAAEDAAWKLLSIDPIDPVAFNTLSRVAPENIDDRLLERFELRALDGAVGAVTSAGILFDLGRIYEARGNYERAFDAVTRANSRMKAIPQTAGQMFDARHEYEQFETRTTLFDKLEPCRLPTGLTPVFIIGLPRTGSTLLDQALSAHPATIGLGEDDIIPRIANEAEALLVANRVTDAQRRMRQWKSQFVDHAIAKAGEQKQSGAKGQRLRFVVDKMLGNSRHLGFLAKLFPEAVFINSCRHDMDVGLSIYFSPLHRANSYATDLGSIGEFILLENRIIAHWQRRGLRVLPVVYERLVDNFEQTLRQTMKQIGMNWHDDCLQFHRQKRPVYTYSAHQVRQKVYRKSKERWLHYRAQLAPLQAVLENAKPAGPLPRPATSPVSGPATAEKPLEQARY